MELVDSHAHLDGPEFDADRDAVYLRAREAGVKRIVLIGLWRSAGNFGRALELASLAPDFLWATVGVHPHDVSRVPEEDWATLQALAADPRVRAIGETGLDYHYLHSPADQQKRRFAWQLELAVAVRKPATIHLREADEDALAILSSSGIGNGPGAVIHCFSGDAKAAERYLALGLSLSFSGIVTFKSAVALAEAAKITPLDRLLIETDAPFLTPVPHRGKRNEPAYVALTAERLAAIKGISVEELGRAALRNTERFLARGDHMPLGTIGKFELLEKLSEGGMGELYRARTVGPGGFERIVALKRIRETAGNDPDFERMFIEEAKVASLLSHQNLVHLYDFGSDGDVPYLAMEIVEGRDLGKVLARAREERTPLTIRDSVRIAHQIASGLDHLHRLTRKGEPLLLVHRDVSPQNIMLSYDGAVKLTDFGIVRWNRRERITRMGVVKGKMGYLAPEQVMDVPMDARADLFSLGIVLWECLTGGRLFPGRTELEVITQALQRPIRPPSSLNADVSPGLDAVVLRALNRDRERRYRSAHELVRALEDLGEEMGTEAELARAMRALFPESARARTLGLASSVGLVRAETSEVRKFLGYPTPGPEGEPIAPYEVSATLLSLPASPTEPMTDRLDLGRSEAETRRLAEGPATRPVFERPVTRPFLKRSRRWLAAAGALIVTAAAGWGWRSAPLDRSTSERGRMTAAGSPATPNVPEPSIAPAAPVVKPIEVAGTDLALPASSGGPLAPNSPVAASSLRSPPRKRGPASSGTLAVINVHPWAEVVVDGHSRNWFTPGRWQVSAGRHQVVLSNSDLAIERRLSVDVTPGGTVVLSGPLNSLQPQSEE